MLNALVTYAAEEADHNPLIPAWYDIIWSAVCFVVILVAVLQAYVFTVLTAVYIQLAVAEEH